MKRVIKLMLRGETAVTVSSAPDDPNNFLRIDVSSQLVPDPNDVLRLLCTGLVRLCEQLELEEVLVHVPDTAARN